MEKIKGVSEWREIGKKYKYWDYFADEVKTEFLKKILPEYLSSGKSKTGVTSEMSFGFNMCKSKIINNAEKDGVKI